MKPSPSPPRRRASSVGGQKLAGALDHFEVDVRGRRVLDAGASTGGFTDCVLQAGAHQVIAVDVGWGQLHQRLRTDPRVITLERTNVRHLRAADVGGPVDVVVADLSFISLRTVAEPLLAVAGAGADLVWLVKPQFEAARREATREKGVITDAAVWDRVLHEVLGTLDRLGATNMGLMTSSLRGADGNVEFLLHARAPGGAPAGADHDALVATALAEVRGRVTRVALLVHGGRNDATELGCDVARWLTDHGHDVVLDEIDATLLRHAAASPDDGRSPVELVVAIGGDGTVLRAAQRAVRDDAAILGVNLGQLGYLAEVEPHAWEPAIEGFLADRHRVEERLMVSAQVGDTDPVRPALNEVVIEKAATGHTVRLGIGIDGEFFTSYVADGIILASPTGSTAYSLSARGPIVAPSHRALLLTPVSPHTLFDRSLVLSPTSEVEVQVLGDRDAVLSVDGQTVADVAAGTSVMVRAAERPARFVTFGGRNFHQILKAKFGLSDR